MSPKLILVSILIAVAASNVAGEIYDNYSQKKGPSLKPQAQPSPYEINPLITPCKTNDLDCIRYVLSQNSDCNIRVKGTIPNQVRFNNVVYESPIFNATFTDQYEIVENLDRCYVSQFYFNQTRARLVMALTCPDLYVQANLYLAAHFPLQEDQIYFYSRQIFYPPVIFTADFDNINDIDLCKTYIFPYVTAPPKYQITGNDEASQKFKNMQRYEVMKNFYIFVMEDLSQKAASYFQLWVNSILCNFDQFCTENDSCCNNNNCNCNNM